jgi:hypothetical protein
VIAIITPVYGWFAEGFDMPLKEAKALEGRRVADRLTALQRRRQ